MSRSIGEQRFTALLLGTFAAVLLIGIVLLAAWLPAGRAAGLEPMIALRHE